MTERRHPRGFSLIEVLLAVVVFASAIMVINNIWGGNLVRIKKSRHINEATFLLQRKITELELQYKKATLASIPDEDSGDFGSDNPQFSWRMESKEFDMPDLSSAMVAEEGANEMLIILVKTMTEFIKKSVKEMKVSVIYRPKESDGRKPMTYSITTLLVNYDQSVSVPGLGGGTPGGNADGDE